MAVAGTLHRGCSWDIVHVAVSVTLYTWLQLGHCTVVVAL